MSKSIFKYPKYEREIIIKPYIFILMRDDSTTYYDDLNQVSENIKKYKDICKFWMVISRPPDDKDHGFWCGDNVGIIFFIKRFNGDTYKI